MKKTEKDELTRKQNNQGELSPSMSKEAFNQEMGRLLANVRDEKGLTQEQVIAGIPEPWKVTKNTYSRYECGEISIPMKTAAEICRSLDTSVEEILPEMYRQQKPELSAQDKFLQERRDAHLLKLFHSLSSEKQQAFIDFMEKIYV